MTRDDAAANAAAALAAVLFGASVVAVRIAVREVPPLPLALLRFGIGSAVLFLGLVVARRDLLVIDRRDVLHLALLGVVLFTIFPITFNVGMRYTEASRGALLLASMPLWSLILARLVARDALSARQVLGVVTSIAGVAIVMADRGASGSGADGSLRGDALLIGTALSGALYNVLAKPMLRRYAGLTVTFYAMAFGALFLVPATLAGGMPSVPSPSGETIAMVLFLGVFGGAVGFSLWTAALRRLSPTQVAVYINLNPIAATLLAATLLHERLSRAFILGFIAVVAGVMIVNWTRAPGPTARPNGEVAEG
ncbi:MAG TPA: DMT family transporter [Candidatus Limnocylindrales bacterium]|nr:DMT family transporter [Candidatus Limnocylindrales bacterium]